MKRELGGLTVLTRRSSGLWGWAVYAGATMLIDSGDAGSGTLWPTEMEALRDGLDAAVAYSRATE